jgi:hypothetical protein
MRIRTTVTLDEDVLERVKKESRARGASFRDTLNDLLRLALTQAKLEPKRGKFRVKPTHMGWRPELNYDCVGGLLDFAEGDDR